VPVPSGRSEHVQSVARAFAVIHAFGGAPGPLTISDVAHRTALTRAAARRFLLTLQHLGYVDAVNGGFRLAPRVLELASTYFSTSGLADAAQPVMEDVAARLHESSSVSVLEGTDILYVARVPTKRIMAINLAIGSRLPAFPTSMGRVLLAHLPPERLDEFFAAAKLRRLTRHTVCAETALRRILVKVREQGWAMVDQETEVGVRSAAAPIRDQSGRVIAAINVSAHASRVMLRQLRRDYVPVICDAARRVSQALGWREPSGRRT
jgi:IclR family transcriptional regulator, pca regulon regulatory protein